MNLRVYYNNNVRQINLLRVGKVYTIIKTRRIAEVISARCNALCYANTW